MEQETDDAVIAAYLAGDEESLATLVDRYMDDAYRFAMKLVGDSEVAEDVVQESFIKAWRHIRRFRPGANFRTWLFSIVRNTAIDRLRKKKEQALSSFENEEGENVLAVTIPDEAPRADELLARAEDAAYIERLLVELNPQYREVILLRYGDGLTFKEIGDILKKPLHTVKSQHRRAVEALRKVASAQSKKERR
ncbi:MAG: sigma-70 family RNA polymerase sigma factor [Candidatus Yonathbacteria bacterium]|nr:sigma-70 family RNA polymerase sigma factor [Candidatus Yonathbacteria bacterium]